MASIKRFEDVEAWKKGRELTQRNYQITSQTKFTRDYTLRDQIRRAAISITSNIAEGFDRRGNREFVQFLAIARGSASELKSQIYTALDVGYVDLKEFAELYQLAHRVVLLIGGFIKYLQQSELGGQKFKTATQRKTPNSEP
jgi:four helix bundle protein